MKCYIFSTYFLLKDFEMLLCFLVLLANTIYCFTLKLNCLQIPETANQLYFVRLQHHCLIERSIEPHLHLKCIIFTKKWKILSFQHIINLKIINETLYIIFFISLQILACIVTIYLTLNTIFSKVMVKCSPSKTIKMCLTTKNIVYSALVFSFNIISLK